MTQIEFVTKLINGRPFDIARNCRLRTGDRHKDDISRTQCDIARFVPFEEKII